MDTVPAKRVLIADDYKPMSQTLLELMTVYTAHQVAVAMDGLDAIVQVEKARPEIVFLDIKMPVLNGIQAARSLRARWGSTTPLLVGYTCSRDSCQVARAAGVFDHVLHAPRELAEILALLESV